MYEDTNTAVITDQFELCVFLKYLGHVWHQ